MARVAKPRKSDRIDQLWRSHKRLLKVLRQQIEEIGHLRKSILAMRAMYPVKPQRPQTWEEELADYSKWYQKRYGPRLDGGHAMTDSIDSPQPPL